MSKLNQQFRLPDGRRLGYDEYGPAEGKPLLYLHGSPSARVEFALFGSEELLQSLNVRLIAMDRPGMGLSDFQPNRRLLDLSQDVLALADHLSIERFAILAYSLGGAYGAACAFAIPHRLTRVGIVGGPAPLTEPGIADGINPGTRRFLELARDKPWASRMFWWMLGAMTRFAPDKFIANAAAALPEPDRASISDPEFQQRFLALIREALRQGPRGAQHEARVAITEWGFRPQDIQIPVVLWHGEEDKNDPIAMGRYMANAIPNSEAKFYPNEGHLSLFKKYAQEIIARVVQEDCHRHPRYAG